MNSYDMLYSGNHFWTAMAVLSAIGAVLSGFADRRRGRRKNIEAVGFMPWTAITFVSVLATVLSIALAIKA